MLKVTNQMKCYLCEGTKLVEREGSVRDMSGLGILECASCGLVFLSSFDHINEGFYEESGMHGDDDLDIQSWLNETEWDDERRFQYFKAELQNRKLLDFGCGAGGFLLKARDLSEQAYGVESESRLKSHFQNNGLSVFQELSEIPKDVQDDGFDIITMFHVLEHIPKPKSLLIELSKLLKDDSQIIVEVPNASDALLTLFKNKPFSNFTYWSCHLFLYTTETLQMLFDQVNFKVNYIKQIQRYPLSNHLYWLAKGKPGGHQKWKFLDSPELNAIYEKQLGSFGGCDTILASITRN